MGWGLTMGYDIEAMVELDGKIVFGMDVAPEKGAAIKRIAPGVGHSYTLNTGNSVLLYRDGAAVETGTEDGESCAAWVFDKMYMGLVLLGWQDIDPWGKWRHNDNPKKHDMPERGKHEMVWQDMTRLDKAMVMAAPKDVTVSGCNPRFDVVTGEITKGIRNYKRFLIEHGAPTGCHLHFGCGKRHTPEKIKCIVTYGLSAYLAQGNEGAIERVNHMGVGMFRPTDYGFEWTDLGTCAARNLILITGIVGMVREVMSGWSDDDAKAMLDNMPFDQTVDALKGGIESSRQVAIRAHEWVCDRFPDESDDTVPWFNPNGNYGETDIRKAWRKWLGAGFPCDGTGYWHKKYDEHNSGLETSTTRALKDGNQERDTVTEGAYRRDEGAE